MEQTELPPVLPAYQALEDKVLLSYNEHRQVTSGKTPPAGNLGDIPYECLKRIMNKISKDTFNTEPYKDKKNQEMLIKAQGNFKRELQRRWKLETKLPEEAECIPSEVVETPLEAEPAKPCIVDKSLCYPLDRRVEHLEKVVADLLWSQIACLSAYIVLVLAFIYMH